MPQITWQSEDGQGMPDSQTITMKQNVRFQKGISPEKCQLDQIQNGKLEAIIDFNMGKNAL